MILLLLLLRHRKLFVGQHRLPLPGEHAEKADNKKSRYIFRRGKTPLNELNWRYSQIIQKRQLGVLVKLFLKPLNYFSVLGFEGLAFVNTVQYSTFKQQNLYNKNKIPTTKAH